MAINSVEELRETQRKLNNLEVALADARTRLSESPEALRSLISLHRKQIRELQHEIDQFIGEAEESSAPVEITYDMLDGLEGTSPISSVEKVLGSFRKALAKIAEGLSQGTIRESGRPPGEIADAVDLEFVDIASGSTRLLLNPPAQRVLDQDGEYTDSTLAERSLEVLEATAEWIASDLREAPGNLQDEELRNLAIRQIKRLSPTESSKIAWIEFDRRTQGGRRRTRFDSQSYQRASRIIESGLSPETVSIQGWLREIDLDRTRFEIRDEEGNRHRCEVVEDLLDDAMEYISSQAKVVVRGHRGPEDTRLTVETIEELPER